jgi:hypothetical protein
MENLRDIHIGNLLQECVNNEGIKSNDLIRKMKISKHKLMATFASKSIETEDLLKWSKFFNIDFFRLYSGHLILHHGISGIAPKKTEKTTKIHIRKNVYTLEIKQFVLSQIESNELSITDAISKYNIPKSTIYKWVRQ